MALREEIAPRTRVDRTPFADVLLAVGIVALAAAVLVAAAVTGLNREPLEGTTRAEWRIS